MNPFTRDPDIDWPMTILVSVQIASSVTILVCWAIIGWSF